MTLGEFFVTISAKGVGAANSAIASVKPVMESLEKTAVKLGNTMKSVFAGATAAVYGFATAGIAGTVQGELFANQFRRMTLAIGSVFLPAVYGAIEAMSRLTEWLQNLNKEQSLTIFKFAALAGGITMIATGIGTIPGIILTAVSGFYLLRDAIGGLDFSSIKPAILEVASAFGNFYRAVIPDLKAIGIILKDAFMMRMSELGALAKQIFPPLLDGWKSVVGIIRVVMEVMNELQPLFHSIVGYAIDGFGALVRLMAKLLKDVKETMELLGTMVTGKIAGNPEWATTKENHAAKMAERDRKAAGDKNKGDPAEQLVNKVGGFESASGTYSRIAQAVINTFDPKKASEDQIGAINQGNAFLKEIRDAFNNKAPAPAAAAP